MLYDLKGGLDLSLVVKALLYALGKELALFSETKVHKLLFLLLYVNKIEKIDDKKYVVKRFEKRYWKLEPNFIISWYGVFSPRVRDALRELEEEGVIRAEADSGMYVVWDEEVLKRAMSELESKDPELAGKLKRLVSEYGRLRAAELEEMIDSMLGVDNPALKGMALGLTVRNYVLSLAGLKKGSS